MFWHNFKYNIKILTRSKSLLFWNFAFILIMSILFRLAFSNMQSSTAFSAIKVAVVKDDDYQNDQYFSRAISTLESAKQDSKDNSPTLTITYVDNFNSANDLLEQKKVIGILEVHQKQPTLTFLSPGVKETILKKIVESIMDKRSVYEQHFSNIQSDIEQQIHIKLKSTNRPSAAELQSEISQMISQNISSKLKALTENTVELNSISHQTLDFTIIEYYSLIAMACLSGAYISMFVINSLLANMSEHGKRLSVSATKKSTLFLSGLLSAFLTHLFLLSLIFLFNIFILHINYGHNLPLITLISIFGSLAGISLGLVTATLIKASSDIKINIITFFYLFLCFLAGMMGPNIKYLVDTNMPLLNRLNPANMIVDGLYSLNLYDNLSRFNLNLVSLIVFSILCSAVSLFVLRKQKYKYL